MDKKEFQIRDEIVEYLEKKGILCWKDAKPLFSSKRGFAKSNGTPDILCVLKDGRFMGIECKTKTGKLSKAQIDFIERISHTKAIFIVARELDDVLRCLLKEKLI